ncbi:MAG: hypothetical protein IPG22_00105 [Acidobacteria bacterium]|nr:hypothetical protein [Acidobacteriota bacterium]
MIRQKSAAKGVVRADEFDAPEFDITLADGNGMATVKPLFGRSFITLSRA